MSETGSASSPTSSKARWLVPLVVIGVGGTLLSLKVRETQAPDPCRGLGVFDTAQEGTVERVGDKACTLNIVVPDTESLTGDCERGRLGFHFARLEAQRYACPPGFETAREGRIVSCSLELAEGAETSCEGLDAGLLRYVPRPAPLP